MDDIYLCAKSDTAIPSALHALLLLDMHVAHMYKHLFSCVPYNMQEIEAADPWCRDDFLRAAIHIDKNHHVHYLDSLISQTVHFSDDKNAHENAFVNRMGIGSGEKTIFGAHSDLNAIVLPFHSLATKHWSLLVFYRDEPNTAHWNAVHYDTLNSLNISSAEVFVYHFCVQLIKFEPQFRLFNNSCRPHVCHVTPWQGDGWSCGYRIIMIALLIAHCVGSRDAVQQSLVEDKFVTNRACAAYMARVIEKCVKFQTLMAVRQRCRNLFDFTHLEKVQYNIESNKL